MMIKSIKGIVILFITGLVQMARGMKAIKAKDSVGGCAIRERG